MTYRDEELGLPGNREIVERALRESTTQVLHLAAERDGRDRPLAERGADLVRGFERVPAAPPARTAEELPDMPVPAADDLLAELPVHAHVGLPVVLASRD